MEESLVEKLIRISNNPWDCLFNEPELILSKEEIIKFIEKMRIWNNGSYYRSAFLNYILKYHPIQDKNLLGYLSKEVEMSSTDLTECLRYYPNPRNVFIYPALKEVLVKRSFEIMEGDILVGYCSEVSGDLSRPRKVFLHSSPFLSMSKNETLFQASRGFFETGRVLYKLFLHLPSIKYLHHSLYLSTEESSLGTIEVGFNPRGEEFIKKEEILLWRSLENYY